MPQEVKSYKLLFNMPRRQLRIMRSNSACTELSRRIGQGKSTDESKFRLVDDRTEILKNKLLCTAVLEIEEET
jgi:hypothetical protein